MKNITIGVDLGGTFVKTALVSREREVIAKDSRPSLPDEGPGVMMDTMADAVRELMAEHKLSKSDVCAIGFGAPGPMNWQEGIVYSPPNLKGWKNVPLAKEMEERLGFPCFVDNDANVACFGEYWMGAGQGTQNMAVLTLGTGVGGGVIVFGELLRGPDGTAGELGHLKVQRGGRQCGCGGKGCIEQYASVTGMLQTVVEKLRGGEKSLLSDLHGGDFEQITGKEVHEAAVNGDAFAQWIFEDTGAWLGLAISSIINYQNPERIVLCGGMINAGDLLFEPVRRVAKENCFEVPAKRCQIVPAGLGSDSGVIGAAGCAMARYDQCNV